MRVMQSHWNVLIEESSATELSSLDVLVDFAEN